MSNKWAKKISAVIASSLLTACISGVPDCDSTEVQDMLVSQIKRYLYDDDTVVIISDIESVYHNREVNLRVCKGNLQVSSAFREKTTFAYHIEYLDVEHKVLNVIFYPSE